MPSCEMCGQDTDSLKKVKIEGAKLKVCDSCSDMGTEVSGPKKKTGSKKRKKSKNTRAGKEELVPNYGSRVKEAREDEQLSIKEVADDLNEKESLIKKIERGELKPDKSLAGKLSEKFSITLYTNPEVADYSGQNKTDDRKATLEDVADVKE